MTYQWREGMAEISGFGGDYEKRCREMLKDGMTWLDAHPDADPRYHGFKNVYGLCLDDNEDAKQLDAAIGTDCSGAMHQAVVHACLWIKANGWEKYCEEMSKKE